MVAVERASLSKRLSVTPVLLLCIVIWLLAYLGLGNMYKHLPALMEY